MSLTEFSSINSKIEKQKEKYMHLSEEFYNSEKKYCDFMKVLVEYLTILCDKEKKGDNSIVTENAEDLTEDEKFFLQFKDKEDNLFDETKLTKELKAFIWDSFRTLILESSKMQSSLQMLAKNAKKNHGISGEQLTNLIESFSSYAEATLNCMQIRNLLNAKDGYIGKEIQKIYDANNKKQSSINPNKKASTSKTRTIAVSHGENQMKNKSLQDLLIMIIQRLPRYILLLRDILKTYNLYNKKDFVNFEKTKAMHYYKRFESLSKAYVALSNEKIKLLSYLKKYQNILVSFENSKTLTHRFLSFGRSLKNKLFSNKKSKQNEVLLEQRVREFSYMCNLLIQQIKNNPGSSISDTVECVNKKLESIQELIDKNSSLFKYLGKVKQEFSQLITKELEIIEVSEENLASEDFFSSYEQHRRNSKSFADLSLVELLNEEGKCTFLSSFELSGKKSYCCCERDCGNENEQKNEENFPSFSSKEKETMKRHKRLVTCVF